MAGTVQLYSGALESLLNHSIDFTSDTMKAVLLTDAYTYNSGHTTFGVLSDNEITDEDYARQTVTGASVSRSGTDTSLDIDDVSFGDSVSIEAKYLVLVHQNPSASDLVQGDTLIACIDLEPSGGNGKSTNSTFSVGIPGLFTVSV